MTAPTIISIPTDSAIEPPAAADPGTERPKASCATVPRAREHEDADARDHVVAAVEQARRELRAEREEQAADRPRRDDGERSQEERAPHLSGHARSLRRQPYPPVRADRLGHRQRPGECDRDEE